MLPFDIFSVLLPSLAFEILEYSSKAPPLSSSSSFLESESSRFSLKTRGDSSQTELYNDSLGGQMEGNNQASRAF
jgi:hypothetical protein